MMTERLIILLYMLNDIIQPHLAWVGGAWPCWGATGGLPGAPPPDLRRLLQDRGALESELAAAAASASPPASPPSAASTAESSTWVFQTIFSPLLLHVMNLNFKSYHSPGMKISEED